MPGMPGRCIQRKTKDVCRAFRVQNRSSREILTTALRQAEPPRINFAAQNHDSIMPLAKLQARPGCESFLGGRNMCFDQPRNSLRARQNQVNTN